MKQASIEARARGLQSSCSGSPPPARTLREVLADAFALSATDRAVLEGYLRSGDSPAWDLSRAGSSEPVRTPHASAGTLSRDYDSSGDARQPVDVAHHLALIAALVQGDRYLNADACAVFLGLVTQKGKPNRRGFFDRVSCRNSFPEPLVIGNEKKWKKSEVERWADDERKIQAKALR